jgi:XTP/dITP diphosphohydrolase
LASDSEPILLATRSSGKLRELGEILRDIGLRTVDLATANIPVGAAEEDIEKHDTFEENALAKARYFYSLTGMPSIGDDSGLEVDALGGAPGVLSRRYSGRSDLDGAALDAANNAKLMLELARLDDERRRNGHPPASRAARYVSVAAFVSSRGEVMRRGTIEGRINSEPRGTDGFGYDPYFEAPELGGTFAEAGWVLKSKVSHRARSFRALATALRERGWA